jgi:Flp pilus assembly protein TadG
MNAAIFHRRFRNERGQALVEFALVLPLLSLILFGIIQFGIVFNNYIDLTDAVRAGARKATVSRQTGDPAGPEGVTKAAVINSAGDITIDPNKITVTSDWQPGHDVTVQAAYPYSIDLFGVVLASGDLHSKTTERVE